MSPVTIQICVESGVRYLKEIAHSLLNQGFRRQIYVSLHGPAFLTAGTLVVDFFDETKVPITYIDLVEATQYAAKQGVKIQDYARSPNRIRRLPSIIFLISEDMPIHQALSAFILHGRRITRA